MVKKTNIRKEFERFTNIINKANVKINELRKKCNHSMATKEYKSNTGNYDPSCDSYWREFNCPECGKYWTEDYSK